MFAYFCEKITFFILFLSIFFYIKLLLIIENLNMKRKRKKKLYRKFKIVLYLV